MTDARSCATHLVEGIPTWLDSLSHVRRRISNQTYHRSYSRAKRKSDSVDSIHSANRPAAIQQSGRVDSTATSPSAAGPAAGLSAVPRPSQQLKSTMKDSEAGHYRTKTMVIVCYDGEVQKGFEGLVRQIGIARNQLRKGKMAARMDQMTSEMTAGLSLLDEGFPTPPSAKLGTPNRSKIGLSSVRTTRTVSSPRSPPASGNYGGGGGGFFDTTDKALENAQGLCERAAHLHLREGNTDKEIRRIAEDLNTVVDLCQAELIKPSSASEATTSHEEPTSLRAPTTPSKGLRLSMMSLEVDDDESALEWPTAPITAPA